MPFPSRGDELKERVTTRLGALRGEPRGRLVAYRGIRYASPPEGRLRLRPPVPVGAWSGTQDATQPAPSPLQNPDPISELLGLSPPAGCSEDCLALDVFVPKTGAAGKPVLVWLPGGAFISGAATAALYDGARLALRGDVVVVCVSYRVGALGFSCVGESERLVPNLGLYDQIEALRFVRDHIVDFGGDPGRVTVFGESAGAGSILSLLGMPAAKGLFRRAIVQSAAPRGMLEHDEAAGRSAAVLAELGLGERDVEALRGLAPEQILEAQARCAAAGPYRTGMFYAPVVDGVHVEQSPWLAATSGWGLEVDLLIGTTRDEMRLYYSGQPRSEAGARRGVEAQLALAGSERSEASRRLFDRYREGRVARGESADPCDVYLEIQTDLSLREPACTIAEQRARRRNTRMYRFDWCSSLDGGIRGACHTIDLPFVFGNLDAPGMQAFAGTGREADALAQDTMDAWSAFARSGDPRHDGIPDWPVYDPERRATLLLGRRRELVEAPMEAERALLASLGCSG